MLDKFCCYSIRCRVGKLLLIHKTLAGIEYISGRSTQLSVDGADPPRDEALQELSTVNRGRVNFIVSRAPNEPHRPMLIGIRRRRLLDRINARLHICMLDKRRAFESPSHLRGARVRVLRNKDLIMRSKRGEGKNESPRARNQFHHGRDVLNFLKRRKPTSLSLRPSLWNARIATSTERSV